LWVHERQKNEGIATRIGWDAVGRVKARETGGEAKGLTMKGKEKRRGRYTSEGEGGGVQY